MLALLSLVGGCFEAGGAGSSEGTETGTTSDAPDTTGTPSSTGQATDGTTSIDSSDPSTSSASSSDGSSDDSSDSSGGEAPEAVSPRWPWNGATTGSVWAVDDDLAVLPRRPTFRWTAASDATRYELQIDDSCETPGFDACAFASPEIDETVDAPSFTPNADLPVSTTAPVGRRYYWRVRACDGASCSEWSAIRYVDVARQKNDYNGDGFADVALGAYLQDNPEVNEGSAYVYNGSVGGLPGSPSRVLDNPDDQASGQFGVILASPGDLNADGFGDLVVTAHAQDGSEVDEGAAYVFYGGPSGLGDAPNLSLHDPDSEAGAMFGLGARGVGDVNADGFADVMLGAPRSDATIVDGGAAYLFLGGAAGVPAAPSLTIPRPADAVPPYFGETFGGGDLDGDGYADALVSTYEGTGAAFLYRGGPDGLAATVDMSLESPTADASGGFGTFMWIGDVNGDDLGDVLVGGYLQDGIGTNEGQLFVYFGATDGIAAAPDQTIANPTSEEGGRFAVGGVTLDIDADGVPEVVIGADRQDNPEADEGAAFVFGSGPTGIDDEPSIVLDNPLDQVSGHMGVVGGPGDFDGDGYADVVASPWRQDNPEADEGNAGIYFGSASGLSTSPTTLDNPLDQAGGHFGVPPSD